MNLFISDAYAQTAGGGTGAGIGQILVMVGAVVVFYFMLIRPQQKRMKDQQALLSRLTAGDEVVTSGGILGRVVEVNDAIVTLEIAEGVRVKVQKPQISALMPKGTLKKS